MLDGKPAVVTVEPKTIAKLAPPLLTMAISQRESRERFLSHCPREITRYSAAGGRSLIMVCLSMVPGRARLRPSRGSPQPVGRGSVRAGDAGSVAYLACRARPEYRLETCPTIGRRQCSISILLVGRARNTGWKPMLPLGTGNTA
jgi:hypothetical protein